MFQSPPSPKEKRRTGGVANNIPPDTGGSSLALALKAQWAVVVSSLNHHHGGSLMPPTSAAPSRRQHEAEVVRLLGVVRDIASRSSAATSGNNSGSASSKQLLDLDELVPLVLAMSIAPLPSVESQVAALQAVMAFVQAAAAGASNPANTSSSLQKVHLGSLLKKHAVLQGIEVALGSAATADVTLSLLELLLCLVSNYISVGESLLLAHDLMLFLCDALEVSSDVEVCFIASIFHAVCSFTDGPRVLVSLNAHHKLLSFLASNTNSNDRNPTSQTTALQVLVSLSIVCPSGLMQLARQASFARVLSRIASEKWLNPVQLACLFITNIAAANVNNSQDLVELTVALCRNNFWTHVACLVGKTSPRCSASASQALLAFTFHHAQLVSDAVVASSSAVHSILWKLLDDQDPVDPSGSRISRNFTALTLALFLAASPKARSVLRTLLTSHFSPVSTDNLRERCVACLMDIDDSFYDQVKFLTADGNSKAAPLSTGTEEIEVEEGVHGDDDTANVPSSRDATCGTAAQPPIGGAAPSSSTSAADHAKSGDHLHHQLPPALMQSRATRAKLIRIVRQVIRVYTAHDDGTVVVTSAADQQTSHSHPGAESRSKPPQQLKSVIFQEALEVIVQLAHHYSRNRPDNLRNPPSAFSSSSTASGLRPSSALGGADSRRSSSSSFSKPRLSSSSSSNPWSPPKKHAVDRTWSIEDLQRSDVLTFEIELENVASTIPLVQKRLEQHLEILGRTLLATSISFPRRRCVLQDLHQNVYPKISMFLGFILQQISSSRAVVKAIAECSRKIDSGNILQLYHATGLLTAAS